MHLELIKVIKQKIKRVRGRFFKKGKYPKKLTETQQSFLMWNAERLGITIEESHERYFSSWAAIDGGHAGQAFRDFNKLSYSLFSVFYSDTDKEVYNSYKLHSYMHFLRMISYYEPSWDDENFIVKNLFELDSIHILDYGCGLAQSSRTLALHLKRNGKVVRLHLVDIPTIRKDFLLWWGKKNKIEINFIDVIEDAPIPDLPDINVCVATEFFEHVYNPLEYLDKFNSVLCSGGFMITNIKDHGIEFMHVSPRLHIVRQKIAELGYSEIKKYQIFRKN